MQGSEMSNEEQRRLELAFKRSGRNAGLALLAFGAVMLTLSFYLASADVPLLRQGRLLLCFSIGALASAIGLIKVTNPSAFKDWI